MTAKRMPSIIYENPEEEDKQSTIVIINTKKNNTPLPKLLKSSSKRSNTTQLKISKDYKYLRIDNDINQDDNNGPKTDRKRLRGFSTLEVNHKAIFANAKNNDRSECLKQVSTNYHSLKEKEEPNLDHDSLTMEQIQLDAKDFKGETVMASVCDLEKEIKYREAWNYFSSLDIEKKRKLVVVEDFSKMNCLKFLLSKCLMEYRLLPQLFEERQRIFSIATISYDETDPFHQKMLRTIYHFFLQPEDTAKFNWELIRLQDDPKKDFREVGMFGAIQIVQIIDKYPSFTIDFFSYLKSLQSQSLFCFILLNVTGISLELLKNGTLIVYCNQQRKVLEVLNDFYFGMLYTLYNTLIALNEPLILKKTPVTIEALNQMLNEVKKKANKNPHEFFWSKMKMDLAYPIENRHSLTFSSKSSHNLSQE